jgi:hypothetical protein
MDPDKLLTSAEREGLLSNLDAAIQEWAQHLYGLAPVNIEIEVKNNVQFGRFAAGPAGSVLRNVNDKGQEIYETFATYKMRTGRAADINKSDIVVAIQPDYMRKNYWIDPNPTQQTDPVPQSKISLVTVLAHELGHGFGMICDFDSLDEDEGFISDAKFASSKKVTVYYSLISWTNPKAPAFVGPTARATYGGDVPVAFFQRSNIQGDTVAEIQVQRGQEMFHVWQNPQQNINHYGRLTSADSDKDMVFFGLMSAGWQPVAGRIHVGEIDWAILKDLGLPVR